MGENWAILLASRLNKQDISNSDDRTDDRGGATVEFFDISLKTLKRVNINIPKTIIMKYNDIEVV